MDRDGTIDLLITTRTPVSRSTGLGTNCARGLNIAYNTQLPLCPSSSSFPLASNPATAPPCRSPSSLCVADSIFSFSFSGPNYMSVPISDLLQGDAKLHVSDTSFSPAQPIVPHTGNTNLDGFPDMLLITEGRVRLLSAPCIRRVAACTARGARRGWREMRKGVDPLTSITDAGCRVRRLGRRWDARCDGPTHGRAG
ncbi:hypothetical protein BC826DRAFT_312838 [Russula brevipes]|nr:hypothetical protein BC826DRAFT_312838 [Russula brevipes]